jgi:hypothetical protein
MSNGQWEDFWRGPLTKADEALETVTRRQKEKTDSGCFATTLSVFPLMGSAIDALPCAAPAGRRMRQAGGDPTMRQHEKPHDEASTTSPYDEAKQKALMPRSQYEAAARIGAQAPCPKPEET